MRRQSGTRPLLEHCEGAEADDRAAVASAFLRLWRQQAKPGVTDLHCEQFCLAVFACDHRRSGVQWSYQEIADRLRVATPTAKKVVQRCEREFGIVSVMEERYARGGQAANRYRIDFPTVRAINAGLVTRAEILSGRVSPGQYEPEAVPGDLVYHPAATTGHPAATTDHPYKERPSIQTSISTPSSPQGTIASPRVAGWLEVEEALLRLPESRRPADWRSPLQAARKAGVTPDHALAILRFYEAHASAYAAGALYHRLRHCHPQVAPEEGWPAPKAAKPSGPSAHDAIAQQRLRVQTLERLTIAKARPEQLTDEQLRSRILAAIAAEGINPSLSTWFVLSSSPAETA